MIKFFRIICIFWCLLVKPLHAQSKLFFDVSSSGTYAINISLCLNGQGPLSCQTYNVSGLVLNILTSIPHHTYPAAGIRINTPGYTVSGCTPIANGYCLFTVGDTSPSTLTLTNTNINSVLTAVGIFDVSNVLGYPLLSVSYNGSNWRLVQTINHFGRLDYTSCAGSGHSSVCTAAGFDETNQTPLLYLSSDGGEIWKQQFLSNDKIELFGTSCTGLGADTVCTVVGQNDTLSSPSIYVGRTLDGKHFSWSQISQSDVIESDNFFQATSCTGSGDTAICTIAGFKSNGVLLYTSFDAGKNWNQSIIDESSNSFLSTSCTGQGSRSICAAAGGAEGQDYASSLWVSTNGGHDWESKFDTYTTTGFNSVSCTGTGSNAVCAACGYSTEDIEYNPMTLLDVSTDGGVTWHLVSDAAGFDAHPDFQSISCTGNGRRAVCSLVGTINFNTPVLYLSIDGGLTWNLKNLSIPHGRLLSTSCTSSGSNTICTAAGYYDIDNKLLPLLLSSVDGGITWKQVTLSMNNGTVTGTGATS
jgi:hypothetical protein